MTVRARAQVAESPSDIPASYLICRTRRKHDESQVHDTITRGTRGKIIEIQRWVRCSRCGYEAVQVIDVPNGFIVKKVTPLYPDNYQVKGGLKREEAWRLYVEEVLDA